MNRMPAFAKFFGNSVLLNMFQFLSANKGKSLNCNGII